MRIGILFLGMALALVGTAIYLGSNVRSDIARSAANPSRTPESGKSRGAEKVDRSQVGEATTQAEEELWMKSLGNEQVGNDVQSIEKMLTDQQISLTPLERRVKDAPVVSRLGEIHRDLGFAVLESGLDQNLRPGMRLAVRREHHIVAEMVVGETVEEAECVANIVPGSVPAGIELRQGDSVIPWATTGSGG